jgi:hypothetical protein
VRNIVRSNRKQIETTIEKRTAEFRLARQKYGSLKQDTLFQMRNSPILDMINPSLRIQQVQLPDQFINVNFMKVHQPNMPHPDFIHKSLSKSKYADSLVENDTRIGRVIDKVRALGLDKGNTLVFWTTDNGAWQDVYPDAGYTPFRGTKGTLREGGNRVPAFAWMPGKVAPGSRKVWSRLSTPLSGSNRATSTQLSRSPVTTKRLPLRSAASQCGIGK